LYYIKFNEYDKTAYQWGDYIMEDSTVIIAVPQGETTDIEEILVAGLGPVAGDTSCVTTTSTTTTVWPSTSTTTTLIP